MVRGLRFAWLVASLAHAAPCPQAQSSASQTWPQRPVRLVVPFGGGSATDPTTRLLAERLSNRWAQPVVVENRPRADSIVAVLGAAFATRDDEPTTVLACRPGRRARSREKNRSKGGGAG